RNLAKKIGLSEGAIFRHFPTKRDIIKGIMDDVAKDLIGSLRNIALSPVKTEEKLFKYLCKNVNYLKENRGITILLFSEATHLGDKDLKDKLNQILVEQKQFIIKIINDGIAEGVWDKKVNAEDIAIIYMGIPITFNIELVLNKTGLNSDNFCKRMYTLILRTLKK
ncbi:MAG TPA: TetR/AcrR family transcriptional regulator, partial [Ignavibacteriaceae bacterium]|nr:TetR/AcrR family transcriptional regulator [Ignavibacteriaceae bacterium]